MNILKNSNLAEKYFRMLVCWYVGTKICLTVIPINILAMNASFIKINLPEYLINFVIRQMKGEKQPVKVRKDTFIGNLLYAELCKVPEDCTHYFRELHNKKTLTLDVSWIGGRSDKRINCNQSYYYIPSSVQRGLENKIEDFFNELFFNIVDIAKEYTDAEYKDLIQSFCTRYEIDFAKNYEMLKKRHYRKRSESLTCTTVL